MNPCPPAGRRSRRMRAGPPVVSLELQPVLFNHGALSAGLSLGAMRLTGKHIQENLGDNCGRSSGGRRRDRR
jgi:hypothetical protein